jgi:1-acyl-sn-glycerol-3-phosphate acyltransferase
MSEPDDVERDQRYKDARPAEFFAPYHERVRGRKPEAKVYELVRTATLLNALITFRARWIDLRNVPHGPLILAPNHASFMDHFFVAAVLRRRIQFMAKSQIFGPPVSTYMFNHGGVFPVRRGYADEEAFITAFAILQRGGAVGMYCEGTRSRNGKIGAQARPGIGRLALESGAAVVPVAILGSHQVGNWKRGRPPRVTVRYGEPLHFAVVAQPTREQQQQVADQILDRIREMHDEMEELGHRGSRRAAAVRRREPRPSGDASASGRRRARRSR